MQQAEKLSLEQIRAFLEASEEVHFEGEKREEIYGWIGRTLQVHSYRQQSRTNRGLLQRYEEKLTGLSRAQVTRLIGGYLKSGEVKEKSYRRHRFAPRYTRADIELLAAVDEAHETLSGERRRPDPQGQPGYLRVDYGASRRSGRRRYRRYRTPLETLLAIPMTGRENEPRKYSSECVTRFAERDLVFFDPDTGLEVRSTLPGPPRLSPGPLLG